MCRVHWAVPRGARPSFGVIHAPVRDQTLVGGMASTLSGVEMAHRAKLDPNRAASGVGFHPAFPVDQRLNTLRFVLEDARMSLRCCDSATISPIEIALDQVDGYLGMGEPT